MTGPSPAEARLLTGAEVAQLLNIAKSTLQPWRESGELEAVPLPRGGWRYPSNQPTIQRALAALGRFIP
jgi:excisionase family DNA binding protein